MCPLLWVYYKYDGIISLVFLEEFSLLKTGNLFALFEEFRLTKYSSYRITVAKTPFLCGSFAVLTWQLVRNIHSTSLLPQRVNFLHS